MEDEPKKHNTSTPKKTLEDFRVGVKDLISSLKPQESDSLEGFVSLCNHGLQNIFGECSVIKLRKLLSETEYVLWFIAKVHEEFVYTLIFKVLWTEESRNLRTYKKMEEAELGWLEDLSYRSFNTLFDFISSQERFDYSVLSDPKIESCLSSFESSLSKVADYTISSSESSFSEEVIEVLEPKKPIHRHHKHHHRHRDHRSSRKPNSSLKHKYRTYETQSTNRRNKTRRGKGDFHRHTKKQSSKRSHISQRSNTEHKTRRNNHNNHKNHKNYKNHRDRLIHKKKSHNHPRCKDSTHLSEEKAFEEKVYTSSDEIVEDIAPKEYLTKKRKGQKLDESDSSSDMLVVQ